MPTCHLLLQLTLPSSSMFCEIGYSARRILLLCISQIFSQESYIIAINYNSEKRIILNLFLNSNFGVKITPLK